MPHLLRDLCGFEPFNIFDSAAFVAQEVMVGLDMGLEAGSVAGEIHLVGQTASTRA
jgi:hypothetical protein